MFEVELKTEATRALRRMKRFHAVQVLGAIETHLRFEPERTSRSGIKKLRGKQRTAFRLRVGEYRVFYDVFEKLVTVVAILHKSETPSFYEAGEEP
jgi:mRNA-degrading endonuclease RelE of RelBE toxin-antitoxin system